MAEVTKSTEVYSEPCEGICLKIDIYTGPSTNTPRPAVLLIHGGGWTCGSRRDEGMRAKQLAKLGMVALSVSYRLAPAHLFPAQLDDCCAAFAWLQSNADRLEVDVDRLAIWGYSAGGHLATLLGLQLGVTVRCVLAGGAPWDFRQIDEEDDKLLFLVGSKKRDNPQVYQAICPASNAVGTAAEATRWFLYHGTNDEVVDAADQLPELCNRLREAGATDVEMLLLEGGGHLSGAINHECVSRGIEVLQESLA